MILVGDCRETLRTLPDQSVHCVVTSPPYFGLRDYKTARWEGGDAECDHKPKQNWVSDVGGLARSEQALAGNAARAERRRGSVCDCGATKYDRQIGLEPTPDEYVGEMVEVFREVRRVLRDDGVFWLNIGDSYANDGKWGGSSGGKHAKPLHGNTGIGRQKVLTGLKKKELIGIPWMLAFALRADGWYLRQEVIWEKPNAMPESVKDRCTKAHETIFMFTKSPRYFYDAEAIQEPASTVNRKQWTDGGLEKQRGHGRRHAGFNGRYAERIARDGAPTMRNKRSVWSVTTKPFREAHFATFPPDLIEPCILAGCPSGGTVLDPFLGAGTTALVAEQHGCRWIGCELNSEYVEIAERRIAAARPCVPSISPVHRWLALAA